MPRLEALDCMIKHMQCTRKDSYNTVSSLSWHTQQEFADAKVVDHLCNAKQRSHYQHTTEAALEQCTPAFRSECTTKHTHTRLTYCSVCTGWHKKSGIYFT